MRGLTLGAMCAAGLVSTIGVSGSSPPTATHAASRPAQHHVKTAG
jgi:hypothetical protein